VFVSNVVNQLYKSTDTVIIGAIPELATAGVAIYSIGHTFPNIMSNLAYVAAAVYTPRVNKMVFHGCTDEEISNMVIRVGRLQAIVAFLVTAGFAAFGQAFITWYAGDGYSEAYWVAIIMMVPLVIASIQSAAHSVLQAKNMHRFRSLMYIFIAVLNLVGTLWLTPRYGIIGAAIPTGVAFLIGPGLMLNWYYWKRVKLDIPRFWKEMCPIMLISLLLLIVARLIAEMVDFFVLRNLICGIGIFTIAYFVLLWHFVCTKTEKEAIRHEIKKFITRTKGYNR
jgi:O-antigen/teichoic acid export membrane protein